MYTTHAYSYRSSSSSQGNGIEFGRSKLAVHFSDQVLLLWLLFIIIVVTTTTTTLVVVAVMIIIVVAVAERRELLVVIIILIPITIVVGFAGVGTRSRCCRSDRREHGIRHGRTKAGQRHVKQGRIVKGGLPVGGERRVAARDNLSQLRMMNMRRVRRMRSRRHHPLHEKGSRAVVIVQPLESIRLLLTLLLLFTLLLQWWWWWMLLWI